MTYLASGPVLVMQLIGENGVSRFQELAGSASAQEGVGSSPGSLRSLYGEGSTHDILITASTSDQANKVSRKTTL